MTQPCNANEVDADKIRKDVIREMDTNGGNYLKVRYAVAELSGIPAMAMTFDEHIQVIEKKLSQRTDHTALLREARDNYNALLEEYKNLSEDYEYRWCYDDILKIIEQNTKVLAKINSVIGDK